MNESRDVTSAIPAHAATFPRARMHVMAMIYLIMRPGGRRRQITANHGTRSSCSNLGTRSDIMCGQPGHITDFRSG
jgi:hypothetical protein